jgi:hypothetical protein
MPERDQAPVVVIDQAAAQCLAQACRRPLGGKPGHRPHRRLISRSAEDRRSLQHGQRVRAESPQLFQHHVTDRGRNTDLVEMPALPPAAAEAQIRPVGHQPHRTLHRQRHTFGALVHEPGEPGRDLLPRQHRRHQLPRAGHVERAQGQPQPARRGGRVRGQPRGQPLQQRPARHVLWPAGHHQAHGLRHSGGQEEQELQRRLIRPVRVLHRQHGHSQAAQQFGQRPEYPVPDRRRILSRLRRGWQVPGPLREHRPQRPGQRAQRQPRHPVGRLSHRIHHRAQGVRVAQWRAVRHQHPVRPARPGGQVLPEQPALADPGLTLDPHHRWRGAQRLPERGHLPLTTHETGSMYHRPPSGAATFPSPQAGHTRSLSPDHPGRRITPPTTMPQPGNRGTTWSR